MKKLLVFILLVVCCRAAHATHYACGASPGTAFNSTTWVNANCDSFTSNGTNANTFSGALTTNPVVGDWVMAFLGHCVTTAVATACPTVAGTNGALSLTDSLGNAAAGTVSISGNDVTWYSGQFFSMVGVNQGHCNWVGGTITITISGVPTAETVTQCVTLTHLKVAATLPTQTNVAYVGPGPGGADLSVAYCCAQSVSWYVVQNGGATDTLTVNACAVFSSSGITCNTLGAATSALSWSAIAIHNSSGIGSMDPGGCTSQQVNCQGQYGQTSAASPFPAQTQLNLGSAGELVLLGGNWGGVSTTPSGPSGWTNLITGSITNTVAIQGIAVASAGLFTAAQNQQDSENEYVINTLAVTPAGSGGAGAGFGSVGVLNSICGFGGSARQTCVAGTTPMLFGNPLTPGSIVHVCHLNSTVSSGNTVSDQAGLVFQDTGNGYVPYDGTSVWLKCWVAINNSSSQVEDTFTVSPLGGADTWFAWEEAGLNTGGPIDQVNKNANATSNSSTGAVTTGSVTTAHAELVTGCVAGFGGPFPNVASGWLNINPFMGPACFQELQGSAGTVNPSATDNTTSDPYAGQTFSESLFSGSSINYFWSRPR